MVYSEVWLNWTRPKIIMSRKIATTVVLLLLLVVCRFSSAQDGGCSPAPPGTLIGGPNKHTNNVPTVNVAGNSLQSQIGGYITGTWTAYSATQVQEHGLWCQVSAGSSAGMSSNIGDWFYPAASNGLTLLNSTAAANDSSTPYQSLKCTNQIGLVVDGDVTNYQGIVRCTTTVPGLVIDANYMAVYIDSVYDSYSGPTVEPSMTLSVLSSRDADPDVMFSFSFNVSFGPPSAISCAHGNNSLVFVSATTGISDPNLSRKVIRSQYISNSQPDMARVTVTLPSQPREERTYTCTVKVEGRDNIVSGTYEIVEMGSGNTTVTVTVAGTPTDVTADRTGYNSVLVSWTAPSLAPAGYEVFYQTAAGASSRLSGGTTSNTELTLTGLPLGETYSIFVVAFGAEGDPVLPSAHSDMATSAIPAQLPQLSDELSLTPTTSSIIVSWTPPQFAPDSYNISYSCQLLCDSELYLSSSDTVDGTATTHTITSLNAGSNCTVSVTAVFGSSTGNTINSSIDTNSEVPSAPEGLINTSVETRSLSIVWEEIPCSDQGGPIAGYRVRYGFGRNTFIVIISDEGSNEDAELTELTPFTSYFVQVAAVNDAGTGEYTNRAFTVTTLQEIPGQVSGLLATPEVVQLTISWSPPSEPNGAIIAYEVYFNSSGEFSYTNTSTTQLILSNLSPNTIVVFNVRAYTIIGSGENVTGQASTGSISPDVSEVSAVALNSTAVRVSWTPVDLPVVDQYIVHYTTVGGVNGTITFPASDSSGVVSGLQEGQQYQFSVTVTLDVNGEIFQGFPDFTQSSVDLSRPPQTTPPSSPTQEPAPIPAGILAGLIVGWVMFGAAVIVIVGSAVAFFMWKKAHPNIKVLPTSHPASPTKIAVV